MSTTRIAQILINIATLGLAVLLMSIASAGDRDREERARVALVLDAEERLEAQRAAAGRAMAWTAATTAEHFAELADIGPRATVPVDCFDASTRDHLEILCATSAAPPGRGWDGVTAWGMLCPLDGTACAVKRGNGYPEAWGAP
jgi:hypothetical protein